MQGKPGCGELEKAVCVAACRRVVSTALLAFPGEGMVPAEDRGQGWERVNVRYGDGEPSAKN